MVLDDFEPDVIHLNNFNYQLTPSMIVEIVKWKRNLAAGAGLFSQRMISN